MACPDANEIKGFEMKTTTYHHDGAVIARSTQTDEHVGHLTERAETISDNPIEFTEWGYCATCEREFMIKSDTIMSFYGEEW